VLCVVCFALLGIAALPNDQAKWLFPLALAVSGSMMAASSVACTAHVFHLVPDRGRAFNISLSSIIMLNAPMLSPLIISMLFELAPPAEPHLGPLDTYQIVLLAGGVLMLLSMGLLRWVQTVHPNRDG
jgi:MFS family permease